MHYLKRSLSKQGKRHFGPVTLNARRLASYLPGQRGLCGVTRMYARVGDICTWNEFISASISEPKLLGWHSATTASVLEEML